MEFREILNREFVSSLPLREAILVHSGTIIRGAIAEMRSRSLGCAVIVSGDRVPTGIFTERSVVKLLTCNASLDNQTVGAFSDPGFIVVNCHEPISRIWDAIKLSASRFICVTDNDGKLVGLTGQRGIAEYVADCFAKQVTVQRLGSTPWMQTREGA